MTAHYLYDPDGHVIAETTPAGVTTREYLWLGDMPVAVIDAVNTASPVTYYVHTDHLMRPLKMTNAAGAVAWDVVWKPFGETFSITAAPKLDLGFPGQWTQSENGLAWNWRRHYDPTTGRYTRPDPLRFIAGPAMYSYVKSHPTTYTDRRGLDNPSMGPYDPPPPESPEPPKEPNGPNICASDPGGPQPPVPPSPYSPSPNNGSPNNLNPPPLEWEPLGPPSLPDGSPVILVGTPLTGQTLGYG
ncbi:MAG: hypothetical protein HZY79_08175 [Rhodoblastus sp.]|nr:MAG: hypothetical protein HZY79_08175 [Rhodoblastus sp.]